MIEFDTESISPEFKIRAISFIERFNTSETSRRWVFGRNIYSQAIAKNYQIAGFVDDFCDSKEWLGLPIIKSHNLELDSIVIIASGGNTLSIKEKLKSKLIDSIDYFAFQKFSQKKLPEIRFNESFTDSYKKNTKKFESVFLRLNDNLSKEIYLKLINFRLTQDISFLEGFTDKQEFQYFDFIQQNCGDLKNFVDVGSYDGYNSEVFMRNYPNFKKVIVIEPNLENYELTRNKLSNQNGLELHQIVLGSIDSFVQFDGEGTTGGIVLNGGMQVQMKTLDEICRDLSGLTLIKMDVEGGEKKVIEGGGRVIKYLKPVLAISGYHKSNDLWEIPEVVLSLNDSYNVYLRHYTETIYETVFYFIPKEMPQELI